MDVEVGEDNKRKVKRVVGGTRNGDWITVQFVKQRHARGRGGEGRGGEGYLIYTFTFYEVPYRTVMYVPPVPKVGTYPAYLSKATRDRGLG
jgi:hypothetical protein